MNATHTDRYERAARRAAQLVQILCCAPIHTTKFQMAMHNAYLSHVQTALEAVKDRTRRMVLGLLIAEKSADLHRRRAQVEAQPDPYLLP
jgi:3-keto-L-gulonate-6-phosphate decarboxylase